MKTKPVPIIICLLACGISCIMSIMQGVPFSRFVYRFALTALIFYIFGVVVRVIIDRAFKADQEDTELTDEGEFEVTSEDEERNEASEEGEDVSFEDESEDSETDDASDET